MEPLLEVKGISKNFVGLRALDSVNVAIGANERVGLIGDNGAGKSTLIKIMSGIYTPDEGEILWNGAPVQMEGPLVARSYGIETIYQDLSLADNLTTAENFFLGRELVRKYLWGAVRFLDEAAMNSKADELLSEMNATIPTRKKVAYLSGGQRQAIAIMRVLLWKAKLIIMDEPTAALGVAERRKVLDLIKELKEHGVSVLLISHNLPDIFEVTERIIILRRGQVVGEERTESTNEHRLITLMMGGHVESAVS